MAQVTAVRCPVIGDAVIVDPEGAAVVCEVQSHPGRHRFRAIALQPTLGLSRLMQARMTGAPLSVPVGPAVLGVC